MGRQPILAHQNGLVIGGPPVMSILHWKTPILVQVLISQKWMQLSLSIDIPHTGLRQFIQHLGTRTTVELHKIVINRVGQFDKYNGYLPVHSQMFVCFFCCFCFLFFGDFYYFAHTHAHTHTCPIHLQLPAVGLTVASWKILTNPSSEC